MFQAELNMKKYFVLALFTCQYFVCDSLAFSRQIEYLYYLWTYLLCSTAT